METASGAAKWLVCSGSGEFLSIAGALVTAGCTEGVEWEPLPARAAARLSQRGGGNPCNAVVGGGLGAEVPREVACTLAGLAQGTTLLCVEGACRVAQDVAARGVDAAVEPAGLLRLLLERRKREAVAPEGSGAPCADAEPPHDADGDPKGPCSGEPDFFVRDGELGMRVPCIDDALEEPQERLQEDPAPTPAASIREGGPCKEGPLGEDGAGTVAAPLGVAGLVTEPVVYRPLVSLPVQECAPVLEGAHVPTICFASARGGVGRSSLAVLAAVSLAREGLSVALVDFDFQFGTCLAYLGADATDGLFDPGTPPERIRVDARSLARCRTTPEAGLAVYGFCAAPEQAEVLSGMAKRLLGAASAGADVAVVDLPVGVNETVAQVLEVADRCLFVADQRPVALKSLAAQQQLCARMGIARTKLVTVMNRCDPRHRDEGFLSRVRFEVQTPQIVRVVDGGPDVAQLLSIGSAGELMTARNRFALSTADLAHAVCADLGCQPVSMSPASRLRELPPAPGPTPVREGFLRRRRKERHEVEEVPCPF